MYWEPSKILSWAGNTFSSLCYKNPLTPVTFSVAVCVMCITVSRTVSNACSITVSKFLVRLLETSLAPSFLGGTSRKPLFRLFPSDPQFIYIYLPSPKNSRGNYEDATIICGFLLFLWDRNPTQSHATHFLLHSQQCGSYYFFTIFFAPPLALLLALQWFSFFFFPKIINPTATTIVRTA